MSLLCLLHSLYASCTVIRQAQEDLLQILCCQRKCIGGESRLDQEEIEVTSSLLRRWRGNRTLLIKVRTLAPGLLLNQCERFFRPFERDGKLAMSGSQILDSGFRDQLAEIDDGDSRTDLAYLGKQVARNDDGFALLRELVHQIAHLDDTGRVK